MGLHFISKLEYVDHMMNHVIYNCISISDIFWVLFFTLLVLQPVKIFGSPELWPNKYELSLFICHERSLWYTDLILLKWKPQGLRTNYKNVILFIGSPDPKGHLFELLPLFDVLFVILSVCVLPSGNCFLLLRKLYHLRSTQWPPYPTSSCSIDINSCHISR
jgi:hypothetical protein